MQGKLVIALTLAAFGADAAICGETVRRQACKKAEQAQQRQPQASQQPQQQPQRKQVTGCPVVRSIPPVVDPTPFFLL
ncbi:MAG TPA: hypothetical protein VFR36_08820 [Sphingomicrobium sp.]|nr:hypothetical protein [Sphingomicrobium sp.]